MAFKSSRKPGPRSRAADDSHQSTHAPGKKTRTAALGSARPVQKKAAPEAPAQSGPAGGARPRASAADIAQAVYGPEMGARDAGPVMRAAATHGAPAADPVSAFQVATSSGSTEVPYRAEMEAAFGHDFSGVSAHLGQAPAMAAIGATAAARGESVAFASAAPDKEVVAHELAHVVQSRNAGAGGVQAHGPVSDPGDAAEREAVSVGKQVAAGKPAPVISARAGAVVHRALADDVESIIGQDLDPVTTTFTIVNKVKACTDQVAFVQLVSRVGAGRLANVLTELVNSGLYDHDSAFCLAQAVAGVNALLGEVRSYLGATTRTEEGLTTLQASGRLDAVLDDTFIDATFLTMARSFTSGKGLLTTQRRLVDAAAAKTSNLATLKALTAIRYDLTESEIKALPVGGATASIGGKVAAATDWDLAGLRQAYQAMVNLPDGHAVGNAHFNKLARYEEQRSSSGWMGGDTIAIGYAGSDLGDTYADNRSWYEKHVTKKPPEVFAGKNYFDATVRHEVGHAVDASIGAAGGSQSYCIGNASGGDWQVYNSEIDLVKAVFAASNGFFHQNNLIDDRLAGVMFGFFGSSDMALCKMTVDALLQTNATWSGMTQPEKDEAFKDEAFKLVSADLEAPWKSAGGPVINGRTFVRSYDAQWGSYEAGARAKQVSNYQFRAPGEWFAEAYAAYFEPDDANAQDHGDRLKRVDATTFNHLKASVDKAL